MNLDSGAESDDGFRRAFRESDELAFGPMQGAHSFPIGVKGEFSHTAQRRPMGQPMLDRKL
jgi:hypothetical protein